MSHLILHKVRGEPSFDVAELAMIAGEEVWIVSTSGHRAYPYLVWSLDDLADVSDINWDGTHDRPFHWNGKLPDDWPDHYAVNDRPMREDSYTVTKGAKGILAAIGLVRKIEVDRRD